MKPYSIYLACRHKKNSKLTTDVFRLFFVIDHFVFSLSSIERVLDHSFVMMIRRQPVAYAYATIAWRNLCK